MEDFSKSHTPPVIATQGFSPECRDARSAIFVANLLSLFFGNREGAQLLEHEISCVDSYGGRLLPTLGLIFNGGENVLLLERQPDPALVGFFESLDLKLPQVEILTRTEFMALGNQLAKGAADHPLLLSLRRHPAEILDGYVTDETISALASTLGKRTLSTPEGSHRGNNKLLLHQHLESIGLPVFPTRLANTPSEVAAALHQLQRDGYRSAGVKSQIGATGIGLIKLPTDARAPEIPRAFFFEGPCMVQAWLQPGENNIHSVHSPSVQMFLHDSSIHLFDLTEQILHESIHQGNESPLPYLNTLPNIRDELLRQTAKAATWLHQQGYRGAASTDFLITRDHDGSLTAYICEINARFTGATYPSVLARHFHPHGAWLMHNLELSTPLSGAALLEKLRIHGELFRQESTSGILPINFNLDPEGLVRKGQFVAIADDPATCGALLDTSRHDLPVTWSYTHDR